MSSVLLVVLGTCGCLTAGCGRDTGLDELELPSMELRVEEQQVVAVLAWRPGACVVLPEGLEVQLDGTRLAMTVSGRPSWRMGANIPLPFKNCPSQAAFAGPLPAQPPATSTLTFTHGTTALAMTTTAPFVPLHWGPTPAGVWQVGQTPAFTHEPASHVAWDESTVLFVVDGGPTLPVPRGVVQVAPGRVSFTVPAAWATDEPRDGVVRLITFVTASIVRCDVTRCAAWPPQGRDPLTARVRITR